MTGQELIDAAGRLIGELRSGRSFNTLESADLLVSLNNLLLSWSEEQFAIYEKSRDVCPLTGAASYTIGTGGTVATTRPITITSAATLSTTSISLPVEIVTSEVWAQRVLDAAETGSFVELLFPDYGMPLITLRVWPSPSTGSLILYSLKPLTSIATLATQVVLPPGYEQALIQNLAVKIAPEFNKQAPPTLLADAERSRNAIAKTNAQLMGGSTMAATAAAATSVTR